MARAKSSLISVGLLLILLPVLAVFQYRWIGEVSAAERDRLESSLRVASDRFAADFDGEFSRLAGIFQIRDGFPETATPATERFQTWSETNAYPQVVRGIYLLKSRPEGHAEFYKVDLAAHELQPGPLPNEFEGIRDRFRPGSVTSPIADRMLLLAPLFRSDRQSRGLRRPDFGPRRFEDPRRRPNGPPPEEGPPRGPAPGPRPGPGPGPGPGGPLEGETIIELDRDIILTELV